MPVVSKLIRKVPGPYLREYFATRKIALPDGIDWEGRSAKLRKTLTAAIESLDLPTLESVRNDAEHIDGMTDEVGQSALKFGATTEQQDVLAEIESAHARALWMFVHYHDQFRHAEESASFDRARNKNTWDSFIAPIDLTVSREKADRKALAQELATFFKSDGKVKVRVEVFDRSREDEPEGGTGLVQVVVLREGQTVSPMVFPEDELDEDEPEPELLPHRPVGELGFTYDPVTGVIEVVAQGKEKREQLVRTFARTLLGRDLEAERVPKRPYDLSVFMTEREFQTDPEDRIAAVKVLLVKFRHDDGRAMVTVESKDDSETIHAVAERLFKERNPFRGGYSIHEVVVAVVFKADRINPRGRTVSVKLRHPNGCSIGETCAKERLIRRKYLPAWKIATDPVPVA
ncbi:hypothetical protein [Magnetospirillum sp. UT-4]|uniref:hypothetical protein n=1 Tax=Magnetospirillum sp. UT-4 TaxID=2681467 RepID=UPI00137DF45D|nr:hypothetical protein [Magnetospirillum sp. UT-4]CAA7615780.1 conserved hypothetical protein [Magnetospirillum sp. UT-4]